MSRRRAAVILVLAALALCAPASGPLRRALAAGDALARLGDPPDNERAREGDTRVYGRPGAPRLVVLHGVHRDGPEDPRIDALARVVAGAGFEVRVPSLPGLRALRPGLADRVRAEQELGGGAAMLGVSVGGTVAVRIAEAQPERVRGVWTIGAPRELRSVLAASRRAGADPYLREVAAAMTEGRSEAAALRAMVPILPTPSRVRVPLFVMHGSDDELIDPSHAHALCEPAPRCRALVTPVLSHARVEDTGLGERYRFARFLAALMDALR